jgi:hypothetical protein
MKKSPSNLLIMASAFFLSTWGHSEPTTRVPLAIVHNNTNAIVSWPYPSTGFGLEFSTNLSATSWQPAAGTSVSDNGRWEVTLPASLPSGFFRLKNHVQHFGFWAGSLAPQGSSVEQNGSVNFTYLQAGFSGTLSDPAVASAMRLLVPSPDFSDTNAVNAIKPYTNSVLAFFMMDEPDCVAGGSTNTLNTLLTSIEAEIVKVKANFAGAKTMFTVGCSFWSYSNFRIPHGMDYIAIESYGSTGDPATTKSEWLAKLNLLCLTTRSTPLSPSPSITLVNGRYKLWSYVNSDTQIMDLGPVVPNAWHVAYLYARKDGKVKLWWDGNLVFDGAAPLVNPFDGYVEWGSGSWQYDATTTADFDWVAYGNNF